MYANNMKLREKKNPKGQRKGEEGGSKREREGGKERRKGARECEPEQASKFLKSQKQQ